jgi:hypothetical protein
LTRNIRIIGDYIRTSQEALTFTACYGDSFTFSHVDDVRTSQETHLWASTACYRNRFTFHFFLFYEYDHHFGVLSVSTELVQTPVSTWLTGVAWPWCRSTRSVGVCLSLPIPRIRSEGALWARDVMGPRGYFLIANIQCGCLAHRLGSNPTESPSRTFQGNTLVLTRRDK